MHRRRVGRSSNIVQSDGGMEADRRDALNGTVDGSGTDDDISGTDDSGSGTDDSGSGSGNGGDGDGSSDAGRDAARGKQLPRIDFPGQLLLHRGTRRRSVVAAALARRARGVDSDDDDGSGGGDDGSAGARAREWGHEEAAAWLVVALAAALLLGAATLIVQRLLLPRLWPDEEPPLHGSAAPWRAEERDAAGDARELLQAWRRPLEKAQQQHQQQQQEQQRAPDAQCRDFWRNADVGLIHSLRDSARVVYGDAQWNASQLLAGGEAQRSDGDDDGEDGWLVCAFRGHLCRGRRMVLDLREWVPAAAAAGASRFPAQWLDAGHLRVHASPGRKSAAAAPRDAAVAAMRADGVPAPHGSLHSWLPEVERVALDDDADSGCTVYVREPVVVMKADAGSNVYHRLNDWVAAWASLVAARLVDARGLSLLQWDVTAARYVDCCGGTLARAFAPQRPAIRRLHTWAGERVCLDDVVWAMPPRTPLGLYFNMPVEAGCASSALLASFRAFVLPRLGVPLRAGAEGGALRATLLLRAGDAGSGGRRLLNADALLRAAREALPDVEVRAVDMAQLPFERQVEAAARSDVLVGLHGAALAHTLWQPPHSALFEAYDCGDGRCYHDLARLAGHTYVTWPREADTAALVGPLDPAVRNIKFTDYRLDEATFVRQLRRAVDVVRERRAAALQQPEEEDDDDDEEQQARQRGQAWVAQEQQGYSWRPPRREWVALDGPPPPPLQNRQKSWWRPP